MSLSVKRKHAVCIEAPGGCRDMINSDCVLYSGANIPLFGLIQGDTVTLAFNKIAYYLNSLIPNIYTDCMAQDAIGSILSTEFNYTSCSEISINEIHWSKIIGAPPFITDYTETDPTVPSWVKAITTTNISHWNQAYSWGNHALAGYLTSFTETDPIFTAHIAATISVNDINHWNLAYNKRVVSAAVTGTTSKRVQLTLGDGSILQSNFFTDVNNYVTAFYFASAGVLAIDRSGLSTLTVSLYPDLDTRYLRTYTETDPTVPSWVKAIPVGANVNHYLGWNGSAWVSRRVDWSEIGNKPTFATQYTDAMAVAAVTGIFQDTKTIDLDYSAGLIKANVIVGNEDVLISKLLVYSDDGYIRYRPVSSLPIPGATHIIEIKFRVGDNFYPQEGDNSFTPLDSDLNAILIGKKVRIWREGDMEFFDDTVKGYEFNALTGSINFYPDLNEGEKIIIWAFADATIQSFEVGAPVILVEPGIALGINIDDNLLI